MKLIYEGSQHKEIDIPYPSLFYPTVAQTIVEDETGKQLTVKASTDDGSVTYRVGMRSGTQTIFEVSNTMPDTYLTDLSPAYLTCVEPKVVEYLQELKECPDEYKQYTFADEITRRCKNTYKEYKLIPENGEITAYYGRMAVQKGMLFGERSVTYPLSSYWIKYYEKIGKGYVDRTHLYMPETYEHTSSKETVIKAASKRSALLTASQRLFEKLKTLAKKAVSAAQVKVPVNRQIIAATKRNLDKMRDAALKDDPIGFNIALLDTISILQRPVATGDGKGVRNMMALSKDDYARIIEREEDLIQAMEGSISGKEHTMKTAEDFDQFKIEVFEASDKQRKEVLNHLSDSLKGKVRNVYRVIPSEQKAAFENYLSKRNITDIKMLWHGSRNENWMSIIRNSLQLNPNAIITGKMFGNGIYFAPSSMKSWNYTSFLGTTWANGSSDTAFMGLYAVAYGNPLKVDHWDAFRDYKNDVVKGNYDSLHAVKGISLRADEIVFYDEAAVLLNYIVEFGS